MDGLFDIRHDALLLITLAVTVVTWSALLTLDVFGLAPVPMIEFSFQNMGLL